jgi:hypothetical protein
MVIHPFFQAAAPLRFVRDPPNHAISLRLQGAESGATVELSFSQQHRQVSM